VINPTSIGSLAVPKRCNVCDRSDSLSEHPFMPDAWLCPDHRPKKAAAQLLAPADCYVIDKSELKALRMDGLLSIKAYVYMALMIDNPKGSDKIDMKAFCMKWGVPAHEMLQAIGQLSRKGLINIKAQEIVADVLTRSQREDALKGVVNGE
jgi:hypothetical protein